jgi:hypothetical protein
MVGGGGPCGVEATVTRLGMRGGISKVLLGATCVVALAAGAACGAGGGGGGGDFAAKPMVLVQFLFVDRALEPSFPTGVQALPRNAQLVFEFSEQVNPGTVNEQSISIRAGPTFLTTAKGSFQVDGSRVIFDPTVTAQGTPNPFGFTAATQFNVELPAEGDANGVVRNRDSDPLLTSFFTQFTTADGYLRELEPPQIERAYFLPDPDPLTKQIPGNGILAFEFSEPMNPASFVLASQVPGPEDSVDIRYNDLDEPNINSANAKENVVVDGAFTWDPSATTFFFTPSFSFGNKKYVFSVVVTQRLTDLSGNGLVNPRSFGPFTSDGTGLSEGVSITESFETGVDNDTSVTTGDWGFTTPGQLEGVPITSRRVHVSSYAFAEAEQGGWYGTVVDPLIGKKLNDFVTGVNPPTNQGRRVMWSVSDAEMGENGSLTVASWGPDSNATFAATYPDVVLRVGYQKDAALSLSPSFASNYMATPLIIYKGQYIVAQATAADEILPLPTNTTGFAANDPLYNFTGFVNWPSFSAVFDWDQGDPAVTNDSVFLFDASVAEGDMFNRMRGWLAVTQPGSNQLISGWPSRRLFGTYEGDIPNPTSNAAANIYNPGPSWTDLAFTLTRRHSIAQSRFYTPPSSGPDAVPTYTGPASAQTTFGLRSNYKTALLTPSIQVGGAQVLVEYQGAQGAVATSGRTQVDPSKPSTAFTTSIDDCDGYAFLRWRLRLTSNLVTSSVAKVAKVVVPVERMP